MNNFIIKLSNFYDLLLCFWEHKSTQKIVTAILISIFLISLLCIELNRNGLLAENLGSQIPVNPFYAVYWAFSILLVSEIISLIFTLHRSFSKAVGKQFEILALIFLRNAFKELVHFSEPINLSGQSDAVLSIASYGLGGLAIFFLLGFYYNQQSQWSEGSSKEVDFYFVAAKKAVSLILLFLFFTLAVYDLSSRVTGYEGLEFFAEFYTILVFSDVLLILISHSFFPEFQDIFRNSGYALATLLMRLSLTAQVYLDVLIGTGAAIFALLLAFTYNKSKHVLPKE